MKQWIMGGVSVVALVTAANASWSLTAQQAWESWQSAAERYGQTMTSSGEATMDGKLTVSGVTLTAEFDEMTVVGTLGDIVFDEQDDGSVDITVPDTIPMTVNGIDEAGDKLDLAMTVTQTDATMTGTDAGSGASFDYAAPSMQLTVDDFKVNDQDVPMDLLLSLDDVEWNDTSGDAEPGSVATELSAAGSTFDLSMDDPEGDGTIKLNATVKDITSRSSGRNMAPDPDGDVGKMLADGFASAGEATYGPVTFNLDLDDGTETMTANGSMTGGNAVFSLDADQMRYDVTYEGLEVTASGGQIPVPELTAQIGRSATTFEIPTQPKDTAAPFAMRIALEDLSVGEEVWSMVDPAGVLPRDPATLVLDLTGAGRWTVDIFDEQAMMSAETPGELESVTLNALELSIAGAELTGEGAFTFPDAAEATPAEMQRPEGTANFKLVGGNALIENLSKVGLIPAEQLMMVRMMTGMFAKPGEGPDELLSEISIDGKGTILINGAPLPF
ncbi:DUF2125 domain-containing protein [Tropicimonas isoalkanivorans]|uniref:DUF2125 domain-containing protein n=1 Tax=Tropicimonas isoalkanivorans TaxID=441112 RepID=A0A1I1KW04_9RHOB|nr:DUF2125 domain-containing protein [Tropicimonas isoalkanivorans]SFC64795.1 hypothetical protein SAMN04488094_107101 [Tropicimonas isoalkanivorans]